MYTCNDVVKRELARRGLNGSGEALAAWQELASFCDKSQAEISPYETQLFPLSLLLLQLGCSKLIFEHMKTIDI